jgi:diaminohydroxyphosphoribosylaminopyrimidine deaminase / 5-amino-6-(5-phosphoribosylamino)uracil reductase
MHEQFMLAALQQAWLGRGCCAPNPSVGAVAVYQGKIIAQSYHRGAGTLHAEQLLIQQLPKNTPGITLYVSLEPCNHWGKTPPCVEAIIAYGFTTVVYGYKDPNPKVMSNDTPSLLRARGIEVLHCPLKDIDEFYQSYHHWILTKKPWVTVKMAQTMNGKIAGKGGARTPLSNESCHMFTHQHRLHSDIILTTAHTINNDDPLLNVRLPTMEQAKQVAIIEGKEKTNRAATLFKVASHAHIFHDVQSPVADGLDRCTFHGVRADEGRLDLSSVINQLGFLGYHDVFVEAGPVLFNAMHQADLVNKTFIYVVPSLLSADALSLYDNSNMFNKPFQLTWQAMADNVIASIDWACEAGEN